MRSAERITRTPWEWKEHKRLERERALAELEDYQNQTTGPAKRVTLGGKTARYEPHEEAQMRELVAQGAPAEAALIHDLKATFAARIIPTREELAAERPTDEQLRLAA